MSLKNNIQQLKDIDYPLQLISDDNKIQEIDEN